MAWARRLTSEPRFSRSASIGRPGQVQVGEDPRDALAVVEVAVVQHRQQAGQPLDDQPVLDEVGRHLLAGAGRRARRRRARARGSSCAPGETVTPSCLAASAQSIQSATSAPRSTSAGVGSVMGTTLPPARPVTKPTTPTGHLWALWTARPGTWRHSPGRDRALGGTLPAAPDRASLGSASEVPGRQHHRESHLSLESHGGAGYRRCLRSRRRHRAVTGPLGVRALARDDEGSRP